MKRAAARAIAAALLISADRLLRRLGYRATLQVFRWTSPPIELNVLFGRTQLQRARWASRLVRRTAGKLRNDDANVTCLRRCLAAWWLSRWLGVQMTIRLGVGREEDGVRGHAWLEFGGAVVGDHPAAPSQYPFEVDVLPASGRSAS